MGIRVYDVKMGIWGQILGCHDQTLPLLPNFAAKYVYYQKVKELRLGKGLIKGLVKELVKLLFTCSIHLPFDID